MKRILSVILVLTLLITTNLSELTAYAESESEVTNAAGGKDKIPEENQGLYDIITENPDSAYLQSVSGNFAFSSLSGKVVDANGNAVENVSVQLYNTDEGVCLTILSTGANGMWVSSEYEVIEGYTYVVRYYKAGYTFGTNNQKYVAEAGGTTIPDAVASAPNTESLVCNEEDYEYTVNEEKATITKYNGEDSEILLPKTLGGYEVVCIGEEAFFKNQKITTVCLSEKITKIGARAFYECSSLKNIYLPNDLAIVENHAFNRCSAIEEIEFPNGLTKIEEYAFYGCSGFSEILLPDTVTTIETRAFADCSKLSSINYPLSLKEADTHIFNGCVSLTEMAVPEGVTRIAPYIFYGAVTLTDVTLPDTLT